MRDTRPPGDLRQPKARIAADPGVSAGDRRVLSALWPMSSRAMLRLQVTVTTDQHWLKLHAGSEYDKEWKRYFSMREEERVSELAEATAAEAELLDSALKWRSVTGGQ